MCQRIGFFCSHQFGALRVFVYQPLLICQKLRTMVWWLVELVLLRDAAEVRQEPKKVKFSTEHQSSTE